MSAYCRLPSPRGIVGGHGAAGAVEQIGALLPAPLGEEGGAGQRGRTLAASELRAVASRAIFAIRGAAAIGLGGGERAVPRGTGLGGSGEDE